MLVHTEPALVTADDLLDMPDDNWSYELVEGRLLRMPKPGGVHGLISLRLTRATDAYVEAHGLGMITPQDTGFLLQQNPDTVRAPDVGFISQAQVAACGLPDKFWPLAPDLAIEVLSPDDRPGRVRDKVRDWLAHGTRLVWVVNPRRRTLTVHRADRSETTLGAHDEVEGEDVLPGFLYRLFDLFKGLRNK